jgi:hypothetical protein
MVNRNTIPDKAAFHDVLLDLGSSSTHDTDAESGDNSEWIFYRLTAFGRTFHFNVTLNRWLVAPSFRVEYFNRNGTSRQRTTSPSTVDQYPIDCYYVGYIAKQEVTSRVAISNCHGLVRISNVHSDENTRF